MSHDFSRASRLLVAAGLVSLLAACNSAGRGATQVASLDGYKPDPTLRSASVSNLKGRVSHACVITQSRLQRVNGGTVEQACGCYADQTLATLDKSEIQSYRATGYFNDSARAKALSALDSCKLPRPV